PQTGKPPTGTTAGPPAPVAPGTSDAASKDANTSVPGLASSSAMDTVPDAVEPATAPAATDAAGTDVASIGETVAPVTKESDVDCRDDVAVQTVDHIVTTRTEPSTIAR